MRIFRFSVGRAAPHSSVFWELCMRRFFGCICLGVTALVLLASRCPASADNITIPGSGGTPAITGYMNKPSGNGPFPAILVLHGCEGYGSLQSQVVDELAGLGYAAVAIDTLKPQGLTNACSDIQAIRTSAQYASAALTWLGAQSYVAPRRLGLLGYSMGAIEILDIIDPFAGPQPAPAGLRAAVAYYPACSNRDGRISVPLLILDGSADDWFSPATCQTLVQTATAAGKTAQITTYPGATHAFNQSYHGTRHFNGHTLTYDPNATADADAKMRAFFAKYLLSP
jgi:dienelactone hydrolase